MAIFLVINIDRGTEEKLTLSQTGLIDRMLSVTEMEECNQEYTPIEKIPLGEDENMNPCRED